MKTIISIFAIVACAGVFAADNGTPEAHLQKVKNPDALFTDYQIEVKFGRYIAPSSLRREMFAVKEKDNDAPVKIKDYTRAGGQSDDGKISGVNLKADFNPSRSYRVTITIPNEDPLILNTEPLENAEKEKKEAAQLINFHYRYFSVEVNPFVADDDAAFGLKYDVRYLLKRRYFGAGQNGVLDINLQTHGEFSISHAENSTNSIQNSLKGGLTVNYLNNVPFTLPLGDESRTYVYPLGFRVAPAEFEANKSLQNVNYTAKVLVGGAIPYADYPALLWNKAFHVGVPFFAPTLFTGFAAVSEVKDDGTDTLSKLGHTRWDTEFIYALPLHQRVDFRFVWNWYVGIEKGFSKDNYEVGAVIYMDDKRSHGFTLSRQHGALPPDFVQTESWRIGYTAQF